MIAPACTRRARRYNAGMPPPATKLTMRGHEVDTAPGAFGELVDSTPLLDDVDGLRQRMDEDGYLFLRGYLDRDAVMAARLEVCRRLAGAGRIDARNHPLVDAVAAAGTGTFFEPVALSDGNEPLLRLLYDGRMIAFYERFLGGRIRHFDYTWFRTATAGSDATPPHCDIVYMGRGTEDLYTSWTPIGDVPVVDGPLCVIPGSHRIRKLRENYCRIDVDAVCTNRSRDGQKKAQSPSSGYLSRNPPRLRRNLGIPFLTTDFLAGDLLVFSMFTIHCALDNHGPRIRLSSDTRYQLAGESVDERWISIDGKAPVAHGENARRELVC